MRIIKIISVLLFMTGLAGCGASGPIKVYDEKTMTDLSKISVLYLPPEVELVEANGEEYDTPYIETGYNEVHLSPGQHALALKYVKYWGDGVSGSMVVSSPVMFNVKTKGNEKFYLKFKKPKDAWDAQTLAKRFSPWIETADSKREKIKGSQFFSGSVSSGKGATAPNGRVKLMNPLKELKFWWEKATYKEKEAFKQWLEEEP